MRVLRHVRIVRLNVKNTTTHLVKDALTNVVSVLKIAEVL